MNNNTVPVITDKAKRVFALLVLLLLVFVPAAAQESMIPDDFDWSIYLQDWEDSWDDGWGAYPQYDEDYQEPIDYSWYGETGTISFGIPDPVPQYDYYGTGSTEYYQVPITQDPVYGQEETGWDLTGYDSDGWFYQIEDGFYDDFQDWFGNRDIPESAYVSGFNGFAQSYNLDCEARSAVDLAAYFGVNIAHSEFLNRLPRSDDPNQGFVGSYTDSRGKIPPSSYGVYQEPVAELLRGYGLNAVGVYAYNEQALKAQIAAGHPVMVWVVGNVELGYSVPYTPASTGRTTYVVPYQHTVIVIGYDKDGVTFQDGALRYSRDWQTFLLSWGTLGNRAIYVN